MATQSRGSKAKRVRLPGCLLFERRTLLGDDGLGRSFFDFDLAFKNCREAAE
jgi:hypothetical protein